MSSSRARGLNTKTVPFGRRFYFRLFSGPHLHLLSVSCLKKEADPASETYCFSVYTCHTMDNIEKEECILLKLCSPVILTEHKMTIIRRLGKKITAPKIFLGGPNPWRLKTRHQFPCLFTPLHKIHLVNVITLWTETQCRKGVREGTAEGCYRQNIHHGINLAYRGLWMSCVGVSAGRQFRPTNLTTGQVASDGRCIDSGLAPLSTYIATKSKPVCRVAGSIPTLISSPSTLSLSLIPSLLSLSHLTHTLHSTLRRTLFKCKWASFRNINVLPPHPLSLCFRPPAPQPVWPGRVALAVGALYCRVDLAKPGVRGTSIIIQPCVSACRRQLLVLALLVLLQLPNDTTLKLLANLQFKSDSYVNINK